MLDVSLPSDVLFHVGPVAITNGVFTAYVITALFAAMALIASRRITAIPGRFQAATELLYEFFFTQFVNAFGSERKARKFVPLLLTLFLFIAVANQFSLVPLVGQVVTGETHVFRLPTSDLTGTLALALLTVGTAQILAFNAAPLKHIGNYVKIVPLVKARSPAQFADALLQLFLGLLDIIGEFAKVVSLAARLFGNIFAGEVMVAIIAALSIWTQFIVPIPFIFLSLFSGFVQAFVFTLLATQFIAGSVAGQPDPEPVSTSS